METIDSPEIPGRGKTSDIPGLSLGKSLGEHDYVRWGIELSAVPSIPLSFSQ